VQGMQEQTALIRALRAPEDFAADLRLRFCARVMERIAGEAPISLQNLFIESAFGRRIAVASLALALLIGVYLVTSERSADQPVMAGQQGQAAVVAGEDGPGQVLSIIDHSSLNQPSEDAVL